MSSPPEAVHLRLSIKQVGDWTRQVEYVRVGEPARIWGPSRHFGDAVFQHPERPTVFSATVSASPHSSDIGCDDERAQHHPAESRSAD